MKKVKVIFLKDLENTAKEGEIKEVAYGYAYNYLIKNGYAQILTSSLLKQIEYERQVKIQKIQRERKRAEDLKKKLEKEKLVFYVKVGEDNKIFGAITNLDIYEKLKEKGYDIDRRDIILDEPIKVVGNYKVPIKLHQEVVAQVKVNVEAED